MIKIYCDMCDEQITGDNILFDMDKTKTSNTLEGALHRNDKALYRNSKILYFTIDVSSDKGLDRSHLKGDFCLSCVIDAVNKLDKRPRARP